MITAKSPRGREPLARERKGRLDSSGIASLNSRVLGEPWEPQI